MKFKSKKRLEDELAEVRADMLYYRGKLNLIEAKLREQKETDGNAYTTLRQLNDIMYYNEGVKSKEVFKG
jgi:hypothetical protein